MRPGWVDGRVVIQGALASLLLRGVDGLNLYRYVRNNPVNGVDAEGYSTDSIYLDKNGQIIAEYDDGDDRVYRHNDIDANNGQHIDGIRSLVDQKRSYDGTGGGGEVVLGLGNSEGEEGRVSPSPLPQFYWHSGSNVRKSGWVPYLEYHQMYQDEARVLLQAANLESEDRIWSSAVMPQSLDEIDLSKIIILDIQGENPSAEGIRSLSLAFASQKISRDYQAWAASQPKPGIIYPSYPETFFFPLPKLGVLSKIRARFAGKSANKVPKGAGTPKSSVVRTEVYGEFISTNAVNSVSSKSLNFSKLPNGGTVDPKLVRFSQNSIAGNFKNGSSVDDLVKKLINKEVDPKSIPAIRLVEKDGLVYTLDNRRLYAFQKANIPIRYQKLNHIPKKQEFKFTTTNYGRSIKVR